LAHAAYAFLMILVWMNIAYLGLMVSYFSFCKE
jgi:hypothetical protein